MQFGWLAQGESDVSVPRISVRLHLCYTWHMDRLCGGFKNMNVLNRR